MLCTTAHTDFEYFTSSEHMWRPANKGEWLLLERKLRRFLHRRHKRKRLRQRE